MKKQYLECGKIVSVHGLDGELKVMPWTSDLEALAKVPTLYFEAGKTPVAVERARIHKGMLLLKLAGITTREQALAYRERVLFINRDDEELEEGLYYVQDLMGLEVVDADTGETYGTLTQVSETGANDVYHIRFADGSEKLIPAIKQVIISVSLEENRMEIRPMRGLFDI